MSNISGEDEPHGRDDGKARNRQFSALYRIRKTAEFGIVYGSRKRVSDAILIVYGMPNGKDYSRLGLSVSKRVGGAVVRNRWKRLVRESFRLNRAVIPPGFDFVVIPKAIGRVPAFSLVAASVRTLTRSVAKRYTD